MKTRFLCPQCERSEKTFTLYIDKETGQSINAIVGRCNREINCGYHYTPKEYFQDNNISIDNPKFLNVAKNGKNWQKMRVIEKLVSCIPIEVFKTSLQDHKTNQFVNFLMQHFGINITNEAVSNYFIGSSNKWNGATVFWQIDLSGKIRSGKIMLYNSITGKRIKEPFNHITWIHKTLKIAEFALSQCFFGEHLLIDKTKHVAIVESEKTAIIANIYLPQFIWLAVGSVTNLTIEKCKILKGHSVVLFPDVNCFEKWELIAKELSNSISIHVSDLLERKATNEERKLGLDLADYLLRFNIEDFNTLESEDLLPVNQDIDKLNKNVLKMPISYFDQKNQDLEKNQQKLDDEILSIEIFFSNICYPMVPIRLNNWLTVTNAPLFVESQIVTLKSNLGEIYKRATLKHLIDFKKAITT